MKYLFILLFLTSSFTSFAKVSQFEGYDMFTVESSDPKSPLNWDMILIGAKNNPITARKVKQGYRTFKYQCSTY